MIRYIPGKTRIKVEFAKNITLGDIIMFIFCLAGLGLILLSQGFGQYKLWFAIAWGAISVSMFIPIDEGLRLYSSIGLLLRFTAFRKKYINVVDKVRGYRNMSEITPFISIDSGKYINLGEYFGMVLEIKPVALELMQEPAQDSLIHTFARGLRRMTGNQSAMIIKTRRPVRFDEFLKNDDEKYELLNRLYEQGYYTADELDSRNLIFRERVSFLQNAMNAEPILQDFFYLVIFGGDKTNLEETAIGIVGDLGSGQNSLNSHILTNKELIVFLKSNYKEVFSEREADNLPPSQYRNWILPKKIEFKTARMLMEGKHYRQFCISNYPSVVGNAWAANMFAMEDSRVVLKMLPIDKEKGEKAIDRVIMEKESKLDRTHTESKRIEQQNDLDSLRILLTELKSNNEMLYDVSIHFTVLEERRKEVKAVLRQEGYRINEMFGRQVDAFISSNISRLQNIKSCTRNMPTTTIASAFPFVAAYMQDPKGFYIGYTTSGYPVFADFFVRDSKAGRINSNMMIIGKSGSGKSYATKTILSNLAADRTKMFILDPEQEYETLTKNLGGKVIDVGSNKSGILNPFHIMASLEDIDNMQQDLEDAGQLHNEDGEEVEVSGFTNKTFYTHLQFLEQFFKIILQGISSDAFELLNTTIAELYRSKGISEKSDLTKLKAEDYPIFDDLYTLIENKLKVEKDQYLKTNYLVLKTYIQKFATGGRNSDLWNGPTSIMTDEVLITFNFQTLFASKNDQLANAQMLLVFKYLNNEIINNKKFNEQYKKTYGLDIKRQVVVAVDEAHMFIDPDFPVALNFMAEMAKRIRKYQGMQIVITQNIKDFLGTQEIQRRSAAIINASQYSLIFQMAPNDMSDLLKLYSSAGGINKNEQERIVTAPRGRCFLISGPVNRQFVDIVALPTCRVVMGEG
ncbi:MAG: ATP-binding protein [Clostridia bacterium]|nr:ATP-binding protein [Clostridia bacterium]